MELIFPRLIQETRPPLNTDDESRGYIVGQPWIDTEESKYYICVCSRVNNAIWQLCVSPAILNTCCESINQRLTNIEDILNAMMGYGINVDFTVTPSSGVPPLTVQFSDTSTSNGTVITKWLWNFGDGTTSSQRNPSKTYNTVGSYNVSLTASSADDKYHDTKTRTGVVTVANLPLPVANFTASPTTGTAPLTVLFSNTSTGTITSRNWIFGDGGTSTQINPSHTYTSEGAYTVSLECTNSTGSNTKTRTNYITVAQITDPQVFDPNLKSFDCTVIDWSSSNLSLPTGWVGAKVNDDSSFKITHNLGVVPSKVALINTTANPDSFLPFTSVVNVVNNSVNETVFNNCYQSNAFICRLLFPATLGGTSGSKVLIYRVSVANLLTNSWALPNGFSMTRNDSWLTIAHNLNKHPTYWQCAAFTASSIYKLYFDTTTSIKVRVPSTIGNTFDIDIYFTI